MDNTKKAAIEAILFTFGSAVELDKIAAAVELEAAEAKALIEELAKEYDETGRGMKIIELEGSYQMCTRDEMYDYLIRIAQEVHTNGCALRDPVHHCIQAARDQGGDREDPRGFLRPLRK